jgi:CHASE1-domain containing sensor protein
MANASPSQRSSAREDLAVVVLLEEQQERWRRGERVLVEAYLAGQDHLRDDSEAVLELILHEVLLRRQRGESAALSEYQQRFPHLAGSLAIQFEVERAIEGDSLTPPTLMPQLDARPPAMVPPRTPLLAATARTGADLVARSPSRRDDHSPADDPSPGVSSARKIPGYEILSELGRGGMGVVYRARHLRLNRVVALKMVLSGGHATAEERVRFLAEAEAIAAVRHPGIVQVFDFGTHDGLSFLSLELCPGGSLAGKVAGTPLAPQEAARLVEQVARAVQAAHEKGIIHRDLKPGNVLLAEDGSPKVTDFGLAKRVEVGTGLTLTGAVLGTPSYIAPEQALGRKDVGPAADVYALGAILYELLTGRPPFKAATTLDTLNQVLSEEPVPPRRRNAAVPRDLETVCLKCLAKEPEQRYASAAALAEDLGRWLDGQPVTACSLGYAWKRLARRHRNLLATAGTCLALLLAGLVVSTYQAVRATAAEQRALEARDRANRALAVAAEADFRRLTEERRHLLADGVGRAIETVVAVAASFEAWPNLTRSELRTFVARCRERNPEIVSVTWAPRVRGADRAAVEAAARAEGIDDFAFRDVNPDGSYTRALAPLRDEHFPVLYVEPMDETNRAVLGLDNSGSPPRMRTLNRTRDTGRLLASAPLRLGQASGGQMGLLLFHPVYRGPAETVADRRRSLAGFVAAAFRIQDLVDRVLGDLARRDVAVTIYDEKAGGPPIYRSPVAPPADKHARTAVHYLDVAGRRWRLELVALRDSP